MGSLASRSCGIGHTKDTVGYSGRFGPWFAARRIEMRLSRAFCLRLCADRERAGGEALQWTYMLTCDVNIIMKSEESTTHVACAGAESDGVSCVRTEKSGGDKRLFLFLFAGTWHPEAKKQSRRDPWQSPTRLLQYVMHLASKGNCELGALPCTA